MGIKYSHGHICMRGACTAKYIRLNIQPTHNSFRVPKGLVAGQKHISSVILLEEGYNKIKYIIAKEGQTLQSLTLPGILLLRSLIYL